MPEAISPQDIFGAQKNIEHNIIKTQLAHSPSLSARHVGSVYLKLETLQITGSFKLRGATNAILRLDADRKRMGIVGVSTGNHGRGLAYAAKRAGIKCVICMSELVPQNKVEAIKALGAEVRIVGRSQDEAQQEVDRLVAQGMSMLPPFDHADIIAGQGTVAIELLHDLPELDTVVVPVSGGGLISGIAVFLKNANPAIRVIGVTMERGCAMYHSQRAGKPVSVEELPTLADSLGGGIGLDNKFTFDLVKTHVDEIILVSEDEIADAIRHAYWQEQQVIEGSGAVGIAALLAGKIPEFNKAVAIVSGRNIDMALHHRIISGESLGEGTNNDSNKNPVRKGITRVN